VYWTRRPAETYVLGAFRDLIDEDVLRAEQRAAVLADHRPLDGVLPELPAAVQTVEVRFHERVGLGVRVRELGHATRSLAELQKYTVD